MTNVVDYKVQQCMHGTESRIRFLNWP